VHEATIFPAFAIVRAGTKTGYDAHMPARGEWLCAARPERLSLDLTFNGLVREIAP
jgi:hypothetical protein